MEPPKVEISMSGCIMASPGPQPPRGVPISAYEASLVRKIEFFSPKHEILIITNFALNNKLNNKLEAIIISQITDLGFFFFCS